MSSSPVRRRPARRWLRGAFEATASGRTPRASRTSSSAYGRGLALRAISSSAAAYISSASSRPRPGASRSRSRTAAAVSGAVPTRACFAARSNARPRLANTACCARVQHGSVSSSRPSLSNTTAAGRSALDSRTVNTRRLGRTNVEASEVGLGAWAVGGAWGPSDDDEWFAAPPAAVDAVVTFFDTAHVYGDGHSERLIGRLLDERRERLVVSTKFGRRAPLDVSHYTHENLRAWLERSRENLGVDIVDLVQLHCPPWEGYYEPAV